MTNVVLDRETATKLKQFRERVGVQDESGAAFGLFLAD